MRRKRGKSRAELGSDRSGDRDSLGETVAREQLEGPVQRELFRMPGWGLSTDGHVSLDLLDHEIPDPAVSELANVRFNPLSQARPSIQTIESHGVSRSDAK
jgi:hypothetical protein